MAERRGSAWRTRSTTLLVMILWAAAPATARVKVGDPIPYERATPVPYPIGHAAAPDVWSEEVHAPGASFLRLRFADLDLAPGDQVVLESPDGQQRHVYTGRGPRDGEAFWSGTIDGDRAVLTLRAIHGGGRGFRVDQMLAAEPEPESTEVVCGGSDGRRDVACFPNGPSASLPVVRLIFQSGPSFYACTGWLVRGTVQNLLITNNHCLTTQAEVDTLVARFNYRRATCGGATDAPFRETAGDAFLRTSAALDYTLLTLAGDPEGQGSGELVATTQEPVAGDRMFFPQHGGGGVKKVAVFEDAAQTIPCRVESVNRSFGSYAPGSQFNYRCDSEGGSSGSPVVNSALRVWGLHHLGNTTLFPCTNGATHMSDICADASDLLDCAAD